MLVERSVAFYLVDVLGMSHTGLAAILRFPSAVEFRIAPRD